MGSFYSKCSITRTTLSGGVKTYIQLLIPRTHTAVTKGYGEEKGLQVSNDGATADYFPFGFPIRGEYYDYGYIDNIERDKNIEKIEKFFELDIETIMKCVMDSRDLEQIEEKCDENKFKILTNLNCTYFNGDIYDMMCEGWDKLPNSKPSGSNDYSLGYRFGEYMDQMRSQMGEKMERPSLDTDIQKKIDNKEKLNERDQIIYDLYQDELVAYYTQSVGSYGKHSYITRYESEKDFTYMLGYHPDEFIDDMKKQYVFLMNLGYGGLHEKLRTSLYGTQETNWKYVMELNRRLERFFQSQEDWDYDWSDEEYEERDDNILDLLSDPDAFEYGEEVIGEIFEGKSFEYMKPEQIKKIVVEAYMKGKEHMNEKV